MRVRSFALAAGMAALTASARTGHATDDHLGTVHVPISCSAEQAKFDRAVALLHNFFYPETVKAFQAIIKEDPACAMAYWGLAMSELPNPLVPPLPPANLKAGWEAIQQGKTAKTQTPSEAEYLAAIEVFYKDYDISPAANGCFGLPHSRPSRQRKQATVSGGLLIFVGSCGNREVPPKGYRSLKRCNRVYLTSR